MRLVDNPKSCTRCTSRVDDSPKIHRVLNIPVGASPDQLCRHFPHLVLLRFWKAAWVLHSPCTSIHNIFGWTSFFGSWILKLLEVGQVETVKVWNFFSFNFWPPQPRLSQPVGGANPCRRICTDTSRTTHCGTISRICNDSQRAHLSRVLASCSACPRERSAFLREMILKWFHWFPNASVCSLHKNGLWDCVIYFETSVVLWVRRSRETWTGLGWFRQIIV